MKVGLGPKEDLKLVSAEEAIGNNFKLMVDANHAYNKNDALYVGKGLMKWKSIGSKNLWHQKITMDTKN